MEGTLSIDEVERKESIDAINDKLNLLQDEKKKALESSLNI